MIDFYYIPGAASLVVHAALEEAGAEYTLHRASKRDGALVPEEAARLNPAGRVPAMAFDGMAMTESVACVMHIADLHPSAGLAPAPGTPERGQFYRWLAFLLNPVQATFHTVIFPARTAPQEAHDAVSAHAIAALEGYRRELDAHLAANGPYLVGETFTGADLFLFMLTRWGRRLDARWWDAPALGAHYRTIRDRPAVQRVFAQEGLQDEA